MNDPYHSMFDKITLSGERKKQILQLNRDLKISSKRGIVRRRYIVSAACIVVLIFFVFGPTRVYANKIFYEFIRLVSVNEKLFNIAPYEDVQLTIPVNLNEIIFEGTLFQYKSYDTLANLEKDLNMDVLDFGYEYNIKDNQVNFQVENHVAGSVNMVIDTKASNEALPISYTLYFSLDKNVPPEQLEYKDNYISYHIEDEAVVFDVGEKYKVIESYRSSNLNTDVLILETIKKHICEEKVYNEKFYYAVFVYNKVEYMLYFSTDLESIKNAIETMK